MAAMAKPMSEPIEESATGAEWCCFLLEDLEELTTLAWSLLADGKLVEEAFARTMTQLESIPCNVTAPALVRDQIRRALIEQAIAVVDSTSGEEQQNRGYHPKGLSELPDRTRLAFVLRMVIRSSSAEVAGFLGITPCEARELVSRAIDQLSGRAGSPC